MTQEDVFLLDILADPDDETPRRVYADWLLDGDDDVRAARGEFIHVQCDLARLATEAARPAELVRRERRLLAAHGREWGSALQRLGCSGWEYRRGFVEGVALPAAALLGHAAALFRLAPIREVKLYQAAGLLGRLAACAGLERVTTLDLEKNHLGDADAAALAGCGRLAALATLLLWSNVVGDAGLAALAASGLPRLARLDLSANAIGDEGARALAAAPLLGRLTLLDLSGNAVADAGAACLAASPHASRLNWLDLHKNPIGPAGQALLRQRFGARVHVLS